MASAAWWDTWGMPDNLARFARLSLQAKTRAAITRDAQLTESEEWARDRVEALERGRARREQLTGEGPPDGCYDCWSIVESFPWTGDSWDWHHGGPIDSTMRVIPEEPDLEPIEHCTHACHGPGGYPIFVVVYG